jgi:hypothetical protein
VSGTFFSGFVRSEIQLHAKNIVNPPRLPRSAGVCASGMSLEILCGNTEPRIAVIIAAIKDNKLRL